MLDHLISLLDDSNDFSWPVAKTSHAVLLCHMEHDEISDTLDRIRRSHAQQHMLTSNKIIKLCKTMPYTLIKVPVHRAGFVWLL